MIMEGRVKVNGNTVVELGTKAVPSVDHIRVDGRLIKKDSSSHKKEYFLFNKPQGVITSLKDDKERPVVMDYVERETRLFPVGRLDYNSEGLLILTNDGDFCKILTDASSGIERVYDVKLRGSVSSEIRKKNITAVKIDKEYVSKPTIKVLRETKTNTWVRTYISTGRNREVRKIFDKLGYSVVRLKRIKYGPFELGNIATGKYRKFNADEIKEAKVIVEKFNIKKI